MRRQHKRVWIQINLVIDVYDDVAAKLKEEQQILKGCASDIKDTN